MSPKSFTFSAALCLALAVGPASVLSVPQMNGLPLLGGDHAHDTAPATGDSEHDAGAGFDVGFPGGPGVRFGAGTHDEEHGPCGPGVNSLHAAGAGYDVGIPGGPGVRFGAGTVDAHHAVPCPEVVEVTPSSPAMVETTPASLVVVETAPATSTYVPVMIPPTYTTPIMIPTMMPAPAYASSTPVVVHSTPLVQHPAPTSTPSSQPVFNAGFPLAPSSGFLVAIPIILGLVY
ncbi:uncharacterized protein N7482_002606 [Penicillium canariense]|uniref:Uncharacterized protein n=1 Tax=Penicillium canariense TaxID=189055 RepID=A0A9W9II33_9EURO|nr:uncharacterized protein N7482_002606 [Penicillium canariense]KAJ5176729.1 hypothetical protein N7482_002606 [Penicillium canariense]